MKNIEVRLLRDELISLINYCIEHNVDNFNLNYGLNRNLDKFESAVKSIEKGVSKELKDLEEIALKKVEELVKEKSEEEKKELNLYELGIEQLSEKDRDRHKELIVKYEEFMNEESDIEPYFMLREKIEQIKIPFLQMRILSKFVKE